MEHLYEFTLAVRRGLYSDFDIAIGGLPVAPECQCEPRQHPQLPQVSLGGLLDDDCAGWRIRPSSHWLSAAGSVQISRSPWADCQWHPNASASPATPQLLQR